MRILGSRIAQLCKGASLSLQAVADDLDIAQLLIEYTRMGGMLMMGVVRI